MSSTPPPEPGPLTEAAGLLASGAIFPRRVGLRSRDRPRSGPPAEPRAEVLAGFKRGAFALYFGDEPIVHFDPLGRWQRAFVAGTHYLKGLDTRVRAVDRVRIGDRLVLDRRLLGAAEVAHLDAEIADRARLLAAALRSGALDLLPPPLPARPIPADELIATLDRITAWDPAAWSVHLDRYRRAFGDGPLPLLPPDCPNPLILRPDARLAPGQLDHHAHDVVELLGERLNQCRDIYLAGSGWVVRPSREVLDLLGTVAARFSIAPDQPRPRATDSPGDAPRFEAILGAIDDPAPILARDHPWSEFRSAQLSRTVIRVSPEPAATAAVRPLVERLKAARIGVSLMASLGEGEVPAFAQLAAELPLGRGDLITLIAGPDAEGESHSRPPDLDEWRSRLAARLGKSGPRVVVYNPDKQWI